MSLRKEVLKAVYPEEYEYLNKYSKNAAYGHNYKKIIIAKMRRRIVYGFKHNRETAQRIVEAWVSDRPPFMMGATEATILHEIRSRYQRTRVL